ncbi:glycine cleavage system T protein [Cladophialophora psammophila CBS 110553]|uniref:aminomethyltransferase n=1 Tax=Cladophialophora psammophila CBS 110553 TaxID=1182543 RepID=W9WVG1_9EURO|nr:glycine cleavage system T protein [Cladophialophora psammophila CBS 110553]EXJ69040.1 glycine cleavage system T protein [Cladophialophora psammophila CBS 110553]
MPPPHRGLRPGLATAFAQPSKGPYLRSRRELSSLVTASASSPSPRQPLRRYPAELIPIPIPIPQPKPTFPPSSFKSHQQRRYASTKPEPEEELKHTPLYGLHASLGAKMVPFASYAMPVTYPDLSHKESHLWTRKHASLFDVSHMVQHKLSGELAEEFLMTITPSAINELEKHRSSLSCLLNDEGGIVDDTVISRIGKDSFYFVTNAGCREKDIAFIDEHISKFLKAKGASGDKINWHVLDHHALLALQGPEAASVLQSLIFNDTEDESLDTLLDTLYFGSSRWLQLTLPDSGMNTPSLLISRTGYTGEDGFEISIPPENGDATELATNIASALTADSSKVRWAGLGARDSLRLEAGMCLYGHDLNEKITPPMAALGWLVGKSRRVDSPTPAFNGHQIINKQLASPKTMTERRVGLLIEKGPAAREGAEIVDPENDNQIIGHITSGSPSPSLDGQNIAMGYIKNGFHKKGTPVGVRVRKNVRKAEVAKMPFVPNKFYTRPS